MQELIICRGIPGSGKSTWASAKVTASSDFVKVSRDDIRQAMFGRLTDVDEDFVTKVEDSMIDRALASGKSVIVDDTNIRHAYVKRIAAIGMKHKVSISIKEFDVNLSDAISRNEIRSKRVPEDVIRKMHKSLKSSGPVNLGSISPDRPDKYVPAIGSAPAILVDIDGTIAHNAGLRGFFDWAKVDSDEPVWPIIEIVHWARGNGYAVILMSGRDASCMNETVEWLEKHGVVYSHLYMRAAGDMRKDSIVKYELFNDHVRHKFDVSFVLDDRNQVVDMWRSIGLRVLQVAEGNF